MRRWRSSALGAPLSELDDDPAASAANLLDLALVFIVVLVAMVSVGLGLPELLNPEARIAIVRNYDSEAMEIVLKEGRRLRHLKPSREVAEGRAVKLGTAYRLDDGQVVYVPDAGAEP